MLVQDLDTFSALDRLVFSLDEPGYRFIPASSMLAFLGGRQALSDWGMFAASWDDLALDTYMADRGRYRRRRHAIYRSDGGEMRRAPHRAHFQARDYNPLNGGIERWYEPISDAVAEGASLKAILATCQKVFAEAQPTIKRWDVEAHQFRIEASAGQVGQPTPEGMHRDGDIR